MANSSAFARTGAITRESLELLILRVAARSATSRIAGALENWHLIGLSLNREPIEIASFGFDAKTGSRWFVLISGTLWRDPATRQSKAGKQFVTALVRAGTPTEAQWVNIAAFDPTVQGPTKLSVFQDKAGEHRASPDVAAAQVLALRQPKKSKPAESSVPTESNAPPLVPAFDDALPF